MFKLQTCSNQPIEEEPTVELTDSDDGDGEDPEEAASGFSPEAQDGKIVAQGGSHVSAPTVTHSTVQGNISINNHYHDHISKINEYKMSICSTYKKVKEYNSGPGENVLLADRYTELLIVERNRKQREREEEIRCRGEHHQQVLKTRASEAYSIITIDQLFKPDDGGDVPKAVILQGHSGHGKSFTAQKVMYDWASGKVFKDLSHLVLHLKCKELNEISEAHSLVDLLSYCPSFTSETAEVLKDSKMKVLFLIDGFDELKFSFEKTSTVPIKDPLTKAPVEATLGALLKGTLLPKCFLLVTTRSTASDKLSKLLSDSQRFTDILGFTKEGVQEYFQRFFKEELQAKKAFDCVRTNETLYTACFIPVICWITCTVFMEQQEEGMDITKDLETTTSIFVHFVSILLKHHCQGLSQPETLLRSLGQLAERGLQEHQVLFDEKSLSEAFPDPSQATKYNPFLCKFLLRRKVKQERMYSFMHLSFQEFFAACQYLMLENEEEALNKLQEMFRNVEHFKAVVQFLFGLSNRDIYPHLKKQSWAFIKAYLQEWLLRVLEKHRMNQEDMLHILHCLYELHEEEFVRRAMGVWGEVKFGYNPLTRTDCWVLLYCLQCCLTIRSLKLHEGNNITAEKLRMLQPALSRCEELGLTAENLSDVDVVDLISALGEGKILTELSVVYSSLSSESVEQVLSALSRQKSVGEVHLSGTTITVTTATLCLDFIQNTETCRHLKLHMESLSDADVVDLISALGEGRILTGLSMEESSLSPESVEQALSALSRQKSVDNVYLSVTTITGTTAALCLDFIQNIETCRHLRLEDNSSPPSFLYVIKDSRGLRVAKSSLSPESVEQVLSVLSRRKCVGEVHLSVTTITGTTAALCFDFIQNTETCRHLSLTVENLSDADVVDLISALGEGKILTYLSSLSPESVEQVLSAISRQKSVDNVYLSVTTITGTTAVLCLDFIQNTETCRHLTLELISWSPSFLSVKKDSSGLSLTVENLSDADVVDLISALGEGKILTYLSVEKSRLSPDSVEQFLSASSGLMSVDDIYLSVTTITGTTAALCLDFIQNTEKCHHLTITVERLSDDDVVDLISGLGEGEILTEPRTESSFYQV
ncbi:NACHT, LRR and PYD domains-containing protein 1 homolog [Clupea harengus]|uniref:NACHT, LRR and PYD domains-containing protein 1 homolog n=1 Tax=Clupea harengus TaxID=7950 RepID=A0A8M1K6R2_CLUHA|nr:NACHT, LRR and PYD domains-containing protein 1 homolog [Clupea harengus]